MTLAGVHAGWASPESDAIDQAKGLLRANKGAEAVAVLQPLADASPDDVEAQFLLGIAKNLAQDYQGAVAPLEKAKAIEPDNAEVHNQLGLAYAALGDLDKAYPELEYVWTHAPETPDSPFQLGYIHYTKTRFPPAKDVFSGTKTSTEERHQLVLYWLALTYNKLGQSAQAEQTMKASIDALPTSELATKARGILQAATTTVAAAAGPATSGDEYGQNVRGAKGDVSPTSPLLHRRKFGVDAFASVLHDDNARLDPKPSADPVATAFRARAGSRSSWGYNVAVRPEYSFHQDDETRVSVSYFGSLTDYDRVRAFDFEDHQLALNVFHRGKSSPRNALLAASLAYDYQELGGATFNRRFSFSPSATLVNPDHPDRANVLYGQIASNRYAGTPDATFLGFENHDGTFLAVGGTHYCFSKDGRKNVRFGLELNKETTKGLDYDYDGFRPTIGGTYSWGDNWSISGDFLHHHRSYDGPNGLFGGFRTDNEDLFLARLTKVISDGWTGFLEYTHDDTHSTLPVFNIEKDVASLGVHYRY